MYHLARSSILGKEIVKDLCVIQAFGNRDLQLSFPADASAYIQQRQHQKHDAKNNGKKSGGQHITGTRGQPGRHGQKDYRDLPGIARNGTKAHQAERAGHGYACADVAVYQ